MTARALSEIHHYRLADDSLSTSGQPTVSQLHAIANAGFAKVVNLALHDDPRYSLPDEAGTVVGLGMSYTHIPVQFAAPSEADLRLFFAEMQARGRTRTWVHCAANLRVSVFLGLYRVVRQGWAREPAFELMRGLWKPDETWSSFIEAMLSKPSF